MHLLNLFITRFSEYAQSVSFLFLKIDYYFDALVAKIQTLAGMANSELSDIITKGSVIIAIKLLMGIGLLIFIRGGLPRYRFDHLTKIGWVKFLTVIVCFFLSELMFIYTLVS